MQPYGAHPSSEGERKEFKRTNSGAHGAGVGFDVLWVSRQLRCPKVSKGERREAGIQWIQPPKAVSDPEFRQTTSGAHGSANRADCLPRGKPFGAPAGAYPLPLWGLTRRLRREGRACSPMGRSHFSFGGERKVCKRKPAARRLQRRPTSLCTAAKPCAALGLGYALHGFQPFLALVGLRPPLVAGFGFAVPLCGALNPRCCAPY